MIKLRVATFAMVLATVGAQASEPQSLPEGFSLSDPKWFEGHIDSSLCRVLHFRGQRLGYVAHEMPAGDGIVFEKCVVREDGVGNTQGWFVATPRNTVFHRWSWNVWDRSRVRRPAGLELPIGASRT